MINKQDKKINATHYLPNKIKSAFEYLSGYSLEDIRVHYDSDKPRKIGAHAYAQGHDIYLAPGKEEHLAHEAWHIVQQKQGRVKATTDINGILVNNDAALEQEADAMAAKIASFSLGNLAKKTVQLFTPVHAISVAQLSLDPAVDGAKVVVVDGVDFDELPLIKIIPPEITEDSPVRKKKYKEMDKKELKGLGALNSWLATAIPEVQLSAENEMLISLAKDTGAKKALPYYKYLKNEKAHFSEKWNTLSQESLDKYNKRLTDNETTTNLNLEVFGLKNVEAGAKNRIELEGGKVFYASRPVQELYKTPYLHMMPFTEDFTVFCPFPSSKGLSPIGINTKNQIICATSAMASLCGYIKATDDNEAATAHCKEFMNVTHTGGLQVNAGSRKIARGFAINLAIGQKRRVSPIFKPSELEGEKRTSPIALNDFFWSTIYPELKPNAGVYFGGGSGHVVSLIKIDNNNYLQVVSNVSTKKDRGVYVTVRSAHEDTKANLGDGFIFSDPVEPA